jgi:hypothetical protein
MVYENVDYVIRRDRVDWLTCDTRDGRAIGIDYADLAAGTPKVYQSPARSGRCPTNLELGSPAWLNATNGWFLAIRCTGLLRRLPHRRPRP